ncbi:hypothetical protein WDU94_001966 [Cyamophila willieti]
MDMLENETVKLHRKERPRRMKNGRKVENKLKDGRKGKRNSEIRYDTLNDPNLNIPCDVRDEIDCVIGQTKLLTSDKFQQMSNLVDQFEQQNCTEENEGPDILVAARGEPRILENDLDSFWDMIYIQVGLMYKKFDRLKQLESDNWIDKEEEAKVKKQAEVAARKAVAKKGPAKVPGGKSRLADFIRTKRMQAQSNGPIGEQEKSEKDEERDETKVFTGVFFKIESPVSKTRSKASPKFTPHVKKSILKNKMSSINMMAVSPLAKSLATSSLVDVISTPSDEMKSILKKKTDKTTGTKLRPFTPGGKKICFSLNEPTTDDEIFSTPRETPQKRIRKTPHKQLAQQASSPRPSEDTPDHAQDEHHLMMDNEAMLDETLSQTLCETSELGNGTLPPQRRTRSSSRREESVSPTITLAKTHNGSRSRRSSQKAAVKITFDDSSMSENESHFDSTRHEENSSPTKHVRNRSVQFLSVSHSSPEQMTADFQQEENSSPTKQLRNRSVQFLSVSDSSPTQMTADFLPRKSPRVSKPPERFSFLQDTSNRTTTPSKKRSQKLPKSGSDSKENRTPKGRTPRKNSTTPLKGSASRSSKKFALRPSRLVV